MADAGSGQLNLVSLFEGGTMFHVSVPSLALSLHVYLLGVFFLLKKKQTKKGGGNHRNALQITEHAVVLGPGTDNEENKKNSSEIIMAFFF